MLSAEEIIRILNLKPHPEEGGYFSETYHAAERLPSGILPERYQGERCLSTAIYYLLTPDGFSAMHRLRSDEIFHFYLGDPVEMLLLFPGGAGRAVPLGPDLSRGMRPQVVVRKGTWQGSRLLPGGRCALLGTTVAPGFEYGDYETGSRRALTEAWPAWRDLIAALTRDG